LIDAISAAGRLPGLDMASPGAATSAKSVSPGGFDEVLKNVATETVNSLYKSEATAIAGINGKASIQQVVDQVMAAERTLQTTIAVRDKAVSAYQEITRMAI